MTNFLFTQQVNGAEFSLPPAFDMKAFKAEILKEMRSEITKAKNEIIDGELLSVFLVSFRFFSLCLSFSREISALA
jgi:VASP tetramerisation domain